MERVERVPAERVDADPRIGQGIEWLRESQRGRMARTLETLVKTARREARRAGSSSERLRWVKTVCYIAQTYNSLLGDTDYDELKRQVTLMQEKVRKLADEKYQEPRKNASAD